MFPPARSVKLKINYVKKEQTKCLFGHFRNSNFLYCIETLPCKPGGGGGGGGGDLGQITPNPVYVLDCYAAMYCPPTHKGHII